MQIGITLSLSRRPRSIRFYGKAPWFLATGTGNDNGYVQFARPVDAYYLADGYGQDGGNVDFSRTVAP